MTDFNASAAMLPLDEYYQQCVIPKPIVPPRYSSNPIPKKNRRQAGHLRSYREVGQDDDDDDEDEDILGAELERNNQEEGASNANLNFEMKDFNKMYWEEAGLPNPELSQSSAQWRTYGNNLNRPAGAAPLVPNEQARSSVKSRLDLRNGSRFRNSNNQGRHFNNSQHRNNFHRGQQQAQSAMEHRMRTAYNAFSSQTTTSQAIHPGDVLTNISNHFQYPQQGPSDLLSSTNMMGFEPNDWTGSSSINSPIDSVSNIPDNRVNNRVGLSSHITPLNDNFASGAQDNYLQEPSLDTTNDSESMKVSKMAHNVLLLLKSVAQRTEQGASTDFLQNIDWMNGPVEDLQSDDMPGLVGQYQQQRFN
ncbi:uncharacterized protein LOC128256089 [Drosophila gunungcola]|uniref:Uncharacterized protein n=1 Tax=Drosophila gunungcola TaxID=103775 RepID=A0A9P9YHG8_9MUSC|nr:uncharacterized protein LOC128256089 [Drosophila gunungcola]KAI8036840.1 hypothetical protein M5D96_010150 [Drosophila gunungcola]